MLAERDRSGKRREAGGKLSQRERSGERACEKRMERERSEERSEERGCGGVIPAGTAGFNDSLE